MSAHSHSLARNDQSKTNGTPSIYPLDYKFDSDHAYSLNKADILSSDPELSRLQQQHNAMVNLMFNKPIHAPIQTSRVRKIVEVGCGVNADMIIYLAKKFPDAKVYGVDLSSIDPDRIGGKIPPNVEFIRGNFLDLIDVDPRLEAGTADYVYSRYLFAGMKSWQIHINLVTELLAPGGWMELHDLDRADFCDANNTVISDDWKWAPEFSKFYASKGLELYGFDSMELKMQTAGLTDATKKLYKLPWAPVSGHPETDAYAEYASTHFPLAWITAIRTAWPGDDNQKWREELEDDVWKTLRKTEGMYLPFHAAWARKPE